MSKPNNIDYNDDEPDLPEIRDEQNQSTK